MIEPTLADSEFLDDVSAHREQRDTFHLWWLGQSGFLVQWSGEHLLLDPYLSDSLTRKYANTDKPHVRMTRRVVDPERLDFVDVATSSHNHTDHLDGETLRPIMRSRPDVRIVVPRANRSFAAERLGVGPERLTGIDSGETAIVGSFEIDAIPAAHESLETDEHGRHRFLGYVIRMGPFCIYHSGDTLWYEGLVTYLEPFDIDVALLPINGRKPERRVAGNLDGPGAARLAHAIGARVVIPCHYDMFTFNTESPDAFVAEASRISQAYHILRAGERFSGMQLPPRSTRV